MMYLLSFSCGSITDMDDGRLWGQEMARTLTKPPWSHCENLLAETTNIHVSISRNSFSRSGRQKQEFSSNSAWHWGPGLTLPAWLRGFQHSTGQRVWWLADSAWTTGHRTPCRPIKACSIMVAVSGSLPSTVCRDEDGAPWKLIGHGTLQAENKLSGAGRQRRLISLRLGWSSSTT